MLSKKCCRNWEVDGHIGDVVYKRGRFKPFALCPDSTVFIIVIGEWNFLRHFPFSNDYRTPLMRFCVGVLVLIRNWTVKTPSNFHYQVASLNFHCQVTSLNCTLSIWVEITEMNGDERRWTEKSLMTIKKRNGRSSPTFPSWICSKLFVLRACYKLYFFLLRPIANTATM